MRTSIFVWTLRRVWRQCHQDRIAQTLALLHLFHIASLNAMITFHFDYDSATDIYICNYNEKQEPQQMDCILLSDNSLRSRTFHSSATKSDH